MINCTGYLQRAVFLCPEWRFDETALRIKTKKIDGVTYILVPAGESMSVNGVDITIKPNE